MATASQLYGTLTAITLTGASLGNLSAQQSASVSNTTNKFLDAILSGTVTTAAVSTGNLYLLLSSYDGSSAWSSPATGSNAAITLPGIAWASMELLQPGQIVPGTGLVLAFKISAIGAAAAAFSYQNLSISSLFGLNGLGLPSNWGVVLVNASGAALSATASVTNYTGVQQTIA